MPICVQLQPNTSFRDCLTMCPHGGFLQKSLAKLRLKNKVLPQHFLYEVPLVLRAKMCRVIQCNICFVNKFALLSYFNVIIYYDV